MATRRLRQTLLRQIRRYLVAAAIAAAVGVVRDRIIRKNDDPRSA